jgi:hypothetical protein
MVPNLRWSKLVGFSMTAMDSVKAKLDEYEYLLK